MYITDRDGARIHMPLNYLISFFVHQKMGHCLKGRDISSCVCAPYEENKDGKKKLKNNRMQLSFAIFSASNKQLEFIEYNITETTLKFHFY